MVGRGFWGSGLFDLKCVLANEFFNVNGCLRYYVGGRRQLVLFVLDDSHHEGH